MPSVSVEGELPGHDKEEEGDGNEGVDEDDEAVHKVGGVEAS